MGGGEVGTYSCSISSHKDDVHAVFCKKPLVNTTLEFIFCFLYFFCISSVLAHAAYQGKSIPVVMMMMMMIVVAMVITILMRLMMMVAVDMTATRR